MNQETIFGRVLDQLLAERGVEGVKGLVALMSEDDRRAIVAHAIRAAAESQAHARHPGIAAVLCRALSLDTVEKQMPLLSAFLSEEPWFDDRVSIAAAAEILGVTEATVRRRIQRGTLDAERDEDGRVWVLDPDPTMVAG